MTEKWAFYFCSILLQLFESTCTESVGANDSNAPSFLHVMESILGASRCFPGTLQPNKHHNVLLSPLEFWRFIFRAEHSGKLIDHAFCDKFSEISTTHIPTHL